MADGQSEAAATQRPTECDIIFRGGITSGVVYPGVVAELSKELRFRSIGGTSAGAIAAALCAAAEHGRSTGSNPQAFEQIRALPESLVEPDGKGRTLLERLFQPAKDVRPLFALLMRSLSRTAEESAGESKGPIKLLKTVWALLATHWERSLLFGVLPFLVFAAVFLPLRGPLDGDGVAFLVLAALGCFLLALITIVGHLVGLLTRALPANGFGLCGGVTEPDLKQGPGLSQWMHERIQLYAGSDLALPLTFGQLWSGGAAGATPEDRAIDLTLVTTDITHRVARSFPFIEPARTHLFFRREELQRVLPAEVVQDMVGKSAARRGALTRQREKAVSDALAEQGLHLLPAPEDLPILLGARMSLSFPFLLSAVPLHSLDYEKHPLGRVATSDAPEGFLDETWYSDGGLVSNFPIHAFDGALPRRPTFAINLLYVNDDPLRRGDKPLDPDLQALREARFDLDERGQVMAVRMAKHNGDGIVLPAVDFAGSAKGRRSGLSLLFSFFMALFDTARNAAETELTTLPGFRDRIASVVLGADEGGMNLRMTPEQVRKLAWRGQVAGKVLIDRFVHQTETDVLAGGSLTLNWRNHRWVRFRSFMASLEGSLKQFVRAWRTTLHPSYEDILRRSATDPISYRWSRSAKEAQKKLEVAAACMDELLKLPRDPVIFDDGTAPEPPMKLRLMPTGEPRRKQAPAPPASGTA